MLKAAEDAELSKYGNVLLEDSLYLLARYTLDSAEGNHTIRCLNLEASKFESIEVNCNHDGVKRIENAHQLGEGFVDMVKDIESLLRKEWLISTVCNKDLKQIANDVLIDSVYMANGTETCYIADEDLEDAVKKEMDDDEDKDEFVDTKQSQIKALVDHRHYQMYNICREIGETQDFENQLKAKLKEHKVVFQNNFPEDVDAEFKIFMASPEAQKTMWELLHGNKLNNEEDIVLSDRKRDVLISGESIQKFVEDIIQMKFKKDILEKEFKRGKEECKMDSLRLHGILTGVHYLKTDDDFFVQHLSLATTFFEHCPAITPE
ncbi:hypothetical protein BD408DRAFT_408502 [Parasitella parasitica]|nr:hypothetical protein BD408DRAFT_408502 [Parasitella parasitica]